MPVNGQPINIGGEGLCWGTFSIRDLDLCSERGTSQHRAWYLEGSSKYFKNKLYCVLCIHYLIMIRK